MVKRSQVALLSDEVRAWLNRELVKRGFSGYEELERLILEAHGEKISKSAIHRYGQKLARKLDAVRASTQAAAAIADAAPDDADLRSSAVISLVQTEIFDVLVNLQEASDEDVDQVTRIKLLSHAAKNIATLSRASVNQKKWQTEVHQRAALIADEVTKSARQAGMSDETADLWRKKILGIAA